jgi:hypothetical protein
MLPRSVSSSKGRERLSHSRIECYNSLHTVNTPEPKKNNNRRNKNKSKNKKPQQTKTVRMVTAVHRDHDHQLKSPHLIKKDDLGVPTIECSINRNSF